MSNVSVKHVCATAYHLQAGLWVQAPLFFLFVPDECKKKKKEEIEMGE